MIRIGAHISSAGGVEKSAERAHALDCTCYQIFSASPRQWRAAPVDPERARQLHQARQRFDLRPLVVHANYLINLAGADEVNRARSIEAFQGELERARDLRAEYLVLHPGSFADSSREAALARLTEAIQACARKFAWGGLTLLIENTAGAGSHLGGLFSEVAEILARLRDVPAACCLDTCHAWVSGYDLADKAGYEAAVKDLDATVGLKNVPVFHVNDAKAARGSHLDRHEHIGDGQLGTVTFRRLLNDPRLCDKAFLLETPVDSDADPGRDLETLRLLTR